MNEGTIKTIAWKYLFADFQKLLSYVPMMGSWDKSWFAGHRGVRKFLQFLVWTGLVEKEGNLYTSTNELIHFAMQCSKQHQEYLYSWWTDFNNWPQWFPEGLADLDCDENSRVCYYERHLSNQFKCVIEKIFTETQRLAIKERLSIARKRLKDGDDRLKKSEIANIIDVL